MDGPTRLAVAPAVAAGLAAGMGACYLRSAGSSRAKPTQLAISDIGVFGMGVMGQNLCLNAADAGFTVSAYNRPDEFQGRIWGALDRATKEGRKNGGEMLIQVVVVKIQWLAAC